MSDDDDDLRFGDVGGSDGDTGSGLSINPIPLAVGGIVAVVLVVGQPLSGTMGSISLNWVGALVVAVGGILGAFSDSF